MRKWPHLLGRGLFIFLIFLGAVLLLQACTPGATPPDTPAGSPTPANQIQPNTVEAGTEQAEVKTSAGTLRVAVQPIVQIDPAFVSSDPEVLVANSVYDYLMDVTVENEIGPRLATEWQISDDGLVYVFQLADGVTFHDGSPLTGEDVAWTFNRLRDPNQGLPTADLYQNIRSVETTGELEVTFTLQEPNPFFLYDLSDNHALILKAGTEDARHRFNGTGPFRVVEYLPEDRLVTEANPDYFQEGKPSLAGVDFIFFPDQPAQVEALRGGQVDLVLLFSAVDLFLSLEGEPGLQTLEVATNQFDLVRLRADRDPGDDPRVIQALKLATDREAIFNLVLQGEGSIGRDTPVGPLYNQLYNADTLVPERNVEAARLLLAEAGYEDGLNLDMHVPDTGNRPNLAVVLKDQWADAGVNVEVIVEPESVYYGDNGWLEVDLGITGWGSRPYPQFYLETMLTCGAVWNESRFCDKEFDRLVETAGTTMDEAERQESYHEIQRILSERGPIIIPYFASQFAALSDGFTGFELNAFPGRSDLRTVRQANP